MEPSLEEKGAAEFKSTIGGICNLSGRERETFIFLVYTLEGTKRLGEVFSSDLCDR